MVVTSPVTAEVYRYAKSVFHPGPQPGGGSSMSPCHRSGLSVTDSAPTQDDILKLIELFQQMRPAARVLLLCEAEQYARSTARDRLQALRLVTPANTRQPMLRATLDVVPRARATRPLPEGTSRNQF